jgi:hypothetical protein
MRFRVWLTQHLGAPATAEPAARAVGRHHDRARHFEQPPGNAR